MRKSVLIVEAEPLLRMLAVDVVEEAGFTALGASNADEAIVMLETYTNIRIVLTDIDMPGSMDGLRLAASRGVLFSKPYDVRQISAQLLLMAPN